MPFPPYETLVVLPQSNIPPINVERLLDIVGSVERFTRIEDRFPLWKTARIIEQEIPEEVRFTSAKRRTEYEQAYLKLLPMDPNVITIDSDWTARVIFLTPPEDRGAMCDLLQNVTETATAFMLELNMAESLKLLLRHAANALTVARANDILDEQLAQCQQYRLPKPMDIARHQLGLTWCRHCRK